MSFTTSSFDRRLASLERAEAGRFGRPLSDSPFAKVALARRLIAPTAAKIADPAALSSGRAVFFQS